MRKLIRYCIKCGGESPKRKIDMGNYELEVYDRRIARCSCGGEYTSILTDTKGQENERQTED